MTGEMHKSELTADAYPAHFAIAKELGGTVEPFDQYQGPYVQLDGAKLWLIPAEGIAAEYEAAVWNESTRCRSEYFPLHYGDPEVLPEVSIAAAREVYPSGGIHVDAPKPWPLALSAKRRSAPIPAKCMYTTPESVRKGETLIYDGGQCGLSATHDDSGVVYIHFAGIGWASVTPAQAAEFASKLSTAVFPFQRTARGKESKS